MAITQRVPGQPLTVFGMPVPGTAYPTDEELQKRRGTGEAAPPRQVAGAYGQMMADDINRLNAQIDAAEISPQLRNELKGISDIKKRKEELDKAIRGEGSYGARTKNWKFLALAKDRPGSAQLFASTATRQQASTGILTGNTQGLLSRK